MPLLNSKAFISCSALLLSCNLFASSLADKIEYPSAKEIIERDLIPPPKKFTMPKDCVTESEASIKNGEIIFNNLNAKKNKIKDENGKILVGKDGKPKQFGNCVACHNIENAEGYGNIGPDLTNYNEYFIKSGVRTHQWLFQKIADSRVDNPNTHMTVNLTNALMSEREVCDLVSYIISKK